MCQPPTCLNIKGRSLRSHLSQKDFFPWCLCAEEADDPGYVRRGYLRSVLLVKVIVSSVLQTHSSLAFQKFKAIFTSPSSSDEYLDDVQEQTQKKTNKRKEPEIGSVPHRAAALDMGCRATSRSIAYAAVQVRSCGSDFDICSQLHSVLQNASQWDEIYDGFDCNAFY